MNATLRRIILVMLLGVLVYGAFIAVSGFEKTRTALQGFDVLALVCALGLSSTNYILRFLKWEYYLGLLGIRGIPKYESFLIFLSGFVLTVTPGKLGEMFKSVVLESTHGVATERTAPIVFAERLTDVIGVVLLISFGSLGFPSGRLWAVLGTFAVSIVLGLTVWPKPGEWLLSYLERGGPKAKRLALPLKTALSSLRIVAHPKALLIPSLISIVGWGLEGYSLGLLVRGFGEPLSHLLALFFYSTSTLAGALVPLPGGLGIAEAMFQSQLVQLGEVSLGTATAAMLMIRFTTLWWAVVVGFFALGLLRVRYPSLLQSGLLGPEGKLRRGHSGS